jgi:hypothetical protein
MGQSLCSEANISAGSQKFSYILSKPNVRYCVYRTTRLVAILARTNTFHSIPLYFFKIHFNIILPY